MSGDGLQGAGEDGGESGRGTGVSREGLHRRERNQTSQGVRAETEKVG